MDIRVIQARLTNCLATGVDDEFLRKQLYILLDDISAEIDMSNRTIDSGHISTVVGELRQYYFTLHDEYDAIPSKTSTLIQRADKVSEIISVVTKITNYISWAITTNGSSVSPDQRRVCAALNIEMENYRKQLFNWTTVLSNLVVDKKIYLLKKQESYGEEKD